MKTPNEISQRKSLLRKEIKRVYKLIVEDKICMHDTMAAITILRLKTQITVLEWVEDKPNRKAIDEHVRWKEK